MQRLDHPPPVKSVLLAVQMWIWPQIELGYRRDSSTGRDNVRQQDQTPLLSCGLTCSRDGLFLPTCFVAEISPVVNHRLPSVPAVCGLVTRSYCYAGHPFHIKVCPRPSKAHVWCTIDRDGILPISASSMTQM